MQGLEVVLVRLASTVASTVMKSVLAPRPGAGLVADPVRPLPKPAGPERLARVLGGRISAGYAAVPENERLAAVAAVQDTFTAAGELTADRLFAADLDPARLAAGLRRPVPDLTERARDLYGELLELCCAHLVEQLTAQPSFGARAALEHTRRTGELLRGREAATGSAAIAFEERYARYLIEAHGRLELFGLTLGRSGRDWPLDTSYLSLAVTGDGGRPSAFGLPHQGLATLKAEQALENSDRILLRGPAGSGKSTLVQWLALNAARREFGPELADWNRCVPFVLRLRAFATAETPPLPEDFLRASGVPLSPPPGWAETLLSEGRALVLVDGVDEVPSRLRSRTETWLKSLVAAFPEARYVVTTRPSAVPEDWLVTQGFAAHSLLPMGRDDIRAFVARWHESVRLECGDEVERARLDTYEKALLHAVKTRRDLGRLATNPLMCALLCALNRDRHMQLPRARKELYDAALEMLLVRRDAEREIVGVEGVTLTRDEQTVLLQRLAYWLIRNGQVEAARDEAVEMVAEWLTAMPQVEADAARVYQHLLIRSGLLREPVPGAVDFVHRTFQDYLGAKAAVEARDFGVLVRNAHDDQWDDVVRMAVGHARVEERGRLLRALLRRADRAPRLRHRLVLLAAACLEHAAELDPEVRREVEGRAGELVPPRDLGEAEELAKVGELVLELLPGPEGLSEVVAAAVVRTAGLVKGDAAFEVITRFREDTRAPVNHEMCEAWASFDSPRFADEVLSGHDWSTAFLLVQKPEQLNAIQYVADARHVLLHGDHPDLTPLRKLTDVKWLYLMENRSVADLSPLSGMRSVRRVLLDRCENVRDVSPLAGSGITRLDLRSLSYEISLEPLRDMPDLQNLLLAYTPLIESVDELPVGPQLTELHLFRETRYVTLDGVERWAGMTAMTLASETQIGELARHPSLNHLTDLSLQHQDPLDLRQILHLKDLKSLFLFQCSVPENIGLLRELPALTRLTLSSCRPIDIGPLADRDDITIDLLGTAVTGEERFPPDRIIRRR
ncbi:NACHT domain-containing protein [Streptomyces aurantiogriseus]|uniref:ATP-binding protein n=1 Tax=Streptomyces aurantiogriseus TaxID=66870 RepID=A0A918FNK9_9ACTN|nr:NACHT domain-containing protein [Streptomyces aurantiogriseus]GGR59907.1 ATP-binding protein [Streptomyces aurantiogriseus]